MENKSKKVGFTETLINSFKNLVGLQWYFYLALAVIVTISVFTGALSTDIMGFIAICSVISILLYQIGEVLPIWNTYVGGGLLMVFFGTAVIQHFNIIPEIMWRCWAISPRDQQMY